MITQHRFWAFLALAVGLLCGPAVRAQSETTDVHPESVRYAVTLLDAGDGTTAPRVDDGTPALPDSTHVRVKVTISVPRTGNTYIPRLNTMPARLMFRLNSGAATAFNAIPLVRDAPRKAEDQSAVETKAGFYPMPQTGATDYTYVASGSALPDYVITDGTTLTDPARWECVYLSTQVYPTTGTDVNPLIASLMAGEGSYEWYASSALGVGSFDRLSDFQDAGRNQTFQDARLWVPHTEDPNWGTLTVDPAVANNRGWGTCYRWSLGTMPRTESGTTWNIHGGIVASTSMGFGGLQLLGVAAPSDDPVRVESPLYPGGVSAVIFDAVLASGQVTPGSLLVQVPNGANGWDTIESVTPTNQRQTFTVAIPAERNATRFRIVRDGTSIGGAENMHTFIISNLLVRSAAPVASFDKAPGCTPDPLYANQVTDDDGDGIVEIDGVVWSLAFTAAGSTDSLTMPRGYDASVQVRRRAHNDATAAWYEVANVSVPKLSGGYGGDTAITASFATRELTTDAAGNVNVTDGAFFMNSASKVTGILPGVYDVRLSYGILGAFLAGRDKVDERESVTGTIATWTEQRLDPETNQPITIAHPMVADLRERKTVNEAVTLKVAYRSGTTLSGYKFLTLDVPMLPDSHKENLWRADVPRILRDTGDDSDVYVYAPDALFNLPDGQTTTQDPGTEGYLSFRVAATKRDGTVTWYGTADGFNAPLDAVPATSSVLERSGANADDVSPVVIPLGIPNSHVTVELTLDGTSAAPALSLCGTYYQDFNTWDATGSGFIDTEFRENVTGVVADFNVRDKSYDDVTGATTIREGWIPDEGPFAQESSYTDDFNVARTPTQAENDTSGYYPFFYSSSQRAVNNGFRQWGASNLEASAQYMRRDPSSTNNQTSYFKMNGTEVVLRRTASKLGDGTWMPNAMLRLTPNTTLTPIADSANGIGTVSFAYSLALPYDIDSRAQISRGGTVADSALYGVAAGIDASGFSSTCSPSGFSVSYYLESASGVCYELRLTQIHEFSTDSKDSVRPTDRVYAEIYEWPNGTGEPGRLPIQQSVTTNPERGSALPIAASKLDGYTFAFWLDANNFLNLGWSNSATSVNQISSQIRTQSAITDSRAMAGDLEMSLGSAECLPTFRAVTFASSKTATYSNGVGVGRDAELAGWPRGYGTVWSSAADGLTTISIRRLAPSGTGALLLRLRRQSGDESGSARFSAEMGALQRASVTLGSANTELTIETDGIANPLTGFYIDEISVTSWCGTDENRNGTGNVPEFTDAGFTNEEVGFAAVGVWVRPKNDAELDANPATYSGEQVLLMQRSRRRTVLSGGTGSTVQIDEKEIGGIRTTAATLALYAPHNEGRGYGPVSFEYCIPAGATGKQPTAVTLMLQYQPSNRPNVDWLSAAAANGNDWVNVSDPITLEPTEEWTTATLMPRFEDGTEIIEGGDDASGHLRLVMVTQGLADSDDPYIYLDNVRVTDNRQGVLASWSAGNVQLPKNPVANLYWKDRTVAGLAETGEASDRAGQVEETFAEKAALTPALLFAGDTEVIDSVAHIDSPLLEAGAGRITFAARLASPSAKPVYVYIAGTASEADAKDLAKDDFTLFHTVEVKNTVYEAFDLDLSKMEPPSATNPDATITYRDIRRLRIWCATAANNAPQDHNGSFGQVYLDKLAVSDPISPSLHVTDVAFSNVAGANVAAEFDSGSPLSQPVVGAPVLRVRAQIGKKQLIDEASIRVFFTYTYADSAADDLKDSTGTYSYQDVLGNTFYGSEGTLYRWPGNGTNWPLSAWFPTINTALASETATAEQMIGATYGQAPSVGNAPASGTIELEVTDSEVGAELGKEYFYGDLSKTGIAGLTENSIVRYAVWVIYQSSLETPGGEKEWFATVIGASDYKEFAWYFPRNLNKEIRDTFNNDPANADAQRDDTSFSPYFWVYSCIPGEVFINEINAADSSGARPNLSSFVELCVPTGVDLNDWRFASTVTSSRGTTDHYGSTKVIAYDTATPADMAPDDGVVPALRQPNTDSSRTFVTLGDVTYAPRSATDTAGNPVNAISTASRNAGWGMNVSPDALFPTGGTSATALAALLYRPTGGAEHIIVFSNRMSNSGANPPAEPIETLYQAYEDAYGANGFDAPWGQAFLSDNWGNHTEAFGDANVTAEDHARRLTKAVSYTAEPKGDGSAGWRYLAGGAEKGIFEHDFNNPSVAVSIATVDMGGTWVSRRNEVYETNPDAAPTGPNGPADLSHLFAADWPIANPILSARPADPLETDGFSLIAEDERGDNNYVQVTPRQVNLDQYLIAYSGLAQCGVTSTLTGNGTHSLHTHTGAIRNGGNTSTTWSVDPSNEPTATLTYTPMPFHEIRSLRIRIRDSKSGKYLGNTTQTEDSRTLPAIGTQVTITAGSLGTVADVNDGWAEVSVNDPAQPFSLDVRLYDESRPDDADTRFFLEAEVTFAIDVQPTDRNLITGVRPFTGASSAAPSALRNQPWRGTGFGFEVDYNQSELDSRVLSLDRVLILYPAPGVTQAGGSNAPWAGAAYDAPLADGSVERRSLEGMTYEAAREQLDTVLGAAGTRYAILESANGTLANASLVPILSTTYSDPDGDGVIDTIEPTIPYIAWGVYTYTFQTDTGTGRATFLIRQSLPEDVDAGAPASFTFPAWYRPLADQSGVLGFPYFYLYSTPPEAAWINEVNAVQAGDDPATQVEVTMPWLRDGIVDAMPTPVPQTTSDGWSVVRYGADGAQIGTSPLSAIPQGNDEGNSASTSYRYVTAIIPAQTADPTAYVLFRPCGAGEGGVWIGRDAAGNAAVTAPTTGTWLDSGANVFPGVTESNAAAGSVQLIGQTVDRNGFTCITSEAAKRDRWHFAAATLEGDNDLGNGDTIPPDTRPDWNRVAFSIVLRNATYGAGTCGTWINGYFVDGVTGRTENGIVSAAGGDWKYAPAEGRAGIVLSFKPRTGYHFASIQLPPELIGRVMLIGGRGALTEANVRSSYDTNMAAGGEGSAASTSTWLNLGNRATVDAATGTITFNPDFDEGNDETFADRDDFVITILFTEEPASALNQITVSFAQGETGAGAWLATQTFFAVDANGAPIEGKGGEAVTFPIWDDADGNSKGEHKDLHGWLYQPIVGDTMGMVAVIDPNRGLVNNTILGATLQDVYRTFADTTTHTRPYLVWSLIPAEEVAKADPFGTDSTNSARGTFFDNWPVNAWLGGQPSLRNGVGTSISLAYLRETIQSRVTGDKGQPINAANAAAGIIPMTLMGYRDPDLQISEGNTDGGIVEGTASLPDSIDDARLAFRTLTPEEFADGRWDELYNADPTLLPFSATLPMVDEQVWKNGAVLRFAIILAQGSPLDGATRVYDCQGIANFTSDGLDAYCPWYVPDAAANINYVSTTRASSREASSPFAWIYTIPADGVWINEAIPLTRQTPKPTSFAVELAMYASPVATRTYTQNPDTGESIATDSEFLDPVKDAATLSEAAATGARLVPKRTLDGWQVRAKVAPMPKSDATLDVPLAWVDAGDPIPLASWIPFHRFVEEAEKPEAYDLDYYIIADERIANGTYQSPTKFKFTDYTDEGDLRFTWKLGSELFSRLPAGASDHSGDYANGTLYAIELVRDNGVVADKVLFYTCKEGSLITTKQLCFDRALRIENASHTVAGTVRGRTQPMESLNSDAGEVLYSYYFAEKTETDGSTRLLWSTYTKKNSLPGPNSNTPFEQPKSAFRTTTGTGTFSISGQIIGGRGSALALTHGSATAEGRAVSALATPGEGYTLTLNGWNDAWFALSDVTKNGTPHTPAAARRVSTFAVSDANGIDRTAGLTIDESAAERDTDYVLTFTYTPDAERLRASGALDSMDEGFLDWLMANGITPGDVLDASAQDGITAAEKYWLGQSGADVVLTDVELAFTQITTYGEDSAVAETSITCPAVSIDFSIGDAPVTKIHGDGVLLLLGKESLDDADWRFIRTLRPEDVNEDRLIILHDTDCKFFRAVLLSAAKAKEYDEE